MRLDINEIISLSNETTFETLKPAFFEFFDNNYK